MIRTGSIAADFVYGDAQQSLLARRTHRLVFHWQKIF